MHVFLAQKDKKFHCASVTNLLCFPLGERLLIDGVKANRHVTKKTQMDLFLYGEYFIFLLWFILYTQKCMQCKKKCTCNNLSPSLQKNSWLIPVCWTAV